MFRATEEARSVYDIRINSATYYRTVLQSVIYKVPRARKMLELIRELVETL